VQGILKQFPYRDADYTFNEKRMVNYTNVYLSMAIQAMMQKDYASLEDECRAPSNKYSYDLL
jgi:hypothetical protein